MKLFKYCFLTGHATEVPPMRKFDVNVTVSHCESFLITEDDYATSLPLLLRLTVQQFNILHYLWFA